MAAITRVLLLAGLSCWTATAVAATTWYVRPDGGRPGQCNGKVDRPYERRVGGDDCAWSHPFHALPPGGEPRIAGGDTLLIRPGSYRIGIGAPGSEGCSDQWPWDCHPAAVPSGPSADQPTRISGQTAPDVCIVKPQLWGAERVSRVLNLDGSNHVEIDCLDITDRSSCVEHHCHGGECKGEVLACKRDSAPFGDWAGSGVFARDSAGVTLRDVDVHGLAVRGFHVGRLRDWTLQRVRIIGNGWSGWDGDLGEEAGSSNSGVMRFEQVEIAWNGCAERYPERTPAGCWAQTAGGYGDGLGTAETAGEWHFVDVQVHHNTSDGLDMLYLADPGSVTVERLRAHDNAGNQLKVSGQARVSQSVLGGRCDVFRDHPNMGDGDHCRALGNTFGAALHPDREVELTGNTIDGVGDCLVVVEGGDASSRVLLRGNRMTGLPMWSDASRNSCGFYAHKSGASVKMQGNRLLGVRGGDCPPDNECSP